MDDITLQLREKIDSSAIAMLLMTEDYGKDLKSCAELGMCIMLDKPILILKHKDVELNNTLRELANDWEEFDDSRGSCEQAAERLLARNSFLFEPDQRYTASRFFPKPNTPSLN